jgi:hypothetical protein
MSAEDVENDLRGVLSQFSNAEKKLAEAKTLKMVGRPLYSITVDSYENLPFPIMRHSFYGRSIEEAERYVASHEKQDAFFRGCEQGRWKDIKCKNTQPVVRKVSLSKLQIGRGKPSMLKTGPIGKMQLRKGS